MKISAYLAKRSFCMNLYKEFDFQKSMSGVTMNAGDGALRRIPGKKSASSKKILKILS